MVASINLIIMGTVDAGKTTLTAQLFQKYCGIDKKLLEEFFIPEPLHYPSLKFGYFMAKIDNQIQYSPTFAHFQVEGRTRFGRGLYHIKTPKVILNMMNLRYKNMKTIQEIITTNKVGLNCGLLVVDATMPAFEAGWRDTTEYMLWCKKFDIQHLVICLNKFDDKSLINPHERFNEIKEEMQKWMKRKGFYVDSIHFVPISGWFGDNLIERTWCEKQVAWYEGPCLMEVINGLVPVAKPIFFGLVNRCNVPLCDVIIKVNELE